MTVGPFESEKGYGLVSVGNQFKQARSWSEVKLIAAGAGRHELRGQISQPFQLPRLARPLSRGTVWRPWSGHRMPEADHRWNVQTPWK